MPVSASCTCRRMGRTRQGPAEVDRANSVERIVLAGGTLRGRRDEALEEPARRLVPASRQLLRVPLNAEEEAPPRGVSRLHTLDETVRRVGDGHQSRGQGLDALVMH